MPRNASFHVPVDASVAEALGNPGCAFVTAGPREYLAGLNCIGRRLDAVGSRYPLLVMVEQEQEAFMRRHVVVNSHPSSAVLSWRHFPEKVNRTMPWRYRSAHVMDKMNLFGMPFRRLVWIDADVFVRRNVDELCELPDDVQYASGLDAEGKPTHCWQPNAKRALCPGKCKSYNMSREAHPYVGLRVSELAQVSPAPESCPYIIQSGVMMLKPLSLAAFNERIVGPVSTGTVGTYDSTDQGMINTMIYKRRIFGDAYMRLHPMYNVIARHAKHTEAKWGGTALTAALLHFTRETRPWQNSPRYDNVTRLAEWTTHCGADVCKLMFNRRSVFKNVSRDGGQTLPVLVGITSHWEPYCNSSRGAGSATDGHLAGAPRLTRLHTRHVGNSSMLGDHQLAAGASLRDTIRDMHSRSQKATQIAEPSPQTPDTNLNITTWWALADARSLRGLPYSRNV